MTTLALDGSHAVTATDADAVSAFRAGDRAALETLVDRTYPVVYRVLCQLCRGNAPRAADLVQETYRRAWAALEHFEGRSSFCTWLCRIAYNVFVDETRRVHEVDGDVGDHADVLPDDTEPPVDSLIRGETARALRRAVLELPHDLRFTVALRFWGEASVTDIARLERVSEVAIRKRLRRAFALLERALEERPAGDRP